MSTVIMMMYRTFCGDKCVEADGGDSDYDNEE